MAFAATILRRDITSTSEVIIGNYTNTGGGEGGDIATGLHHIDACFLQPKGAGAVLANQATVTETFPLAGGTVTIFTTADECGTFIIIGN